MTCALLTIFRPVYVTTVQSNLHKDFVVNLKLITKQRSTIRILEQCSNGSYDRSIICHGNNIYNYAEILAVSMFY